LRFRYFVEEGPNWPTLFYKWDTQKERMMIRMPYPHDNGWEMDPLASTPEELQEEIQVLHEYNITFTEIDESIMNFRFNQATKEA
jgi:hypothetical protein